MKVEAETGVKELKAKGCLGPHQLTEAGRAVFQSPQESEAHTDTIKTQTQSPELSGVQF